MILIAEEFVSVQGTGHLAGVVQYFVRFAGCSVRCPIRGECDEPDALKREAGAELEADDVARRAMLAVGCGSWLHITGGEPTDQPDGLREMVAAAHHAGLRVHIQTSGVREVPWCEWVTVSPKSELRQRCGDELVLVDRGQGIDELRALQAHTGFRHYFLLPLWGGDAGTSYQKVIRMGRPWRLAAQQHKHWGVR